MNERSINRVELQGRVSTVRIQSIGDQMVSTFSLQTNHFYTLKDGSAKVCETAWHCICAYESEDVVTAGLTRGSLVHLEGRLRTNRYTAADGSERTFTEVIAATLRVVE